MDWRRKTKMRRFRLHRRYWGILLQNYLHGGAIVEQEKQTCQETQLTELGGGTTKTDRGTIYTLTI